MRGKHASHIPACANAEMNHTMRTGNKSILADVLIEKFKRPESATVQENAALFIDGFSLVAAIGKPEKAKTFGGFADCHVDAVFRKGFRYQRIDVFFYYYRTHSIKPPTGSQHSKNTVQPVRRVIEGGEVPLSMKWQAFLALGDNKGDLAWISQSNVSCKHLLTLHGSIWRLFKRRGCSLLES